eukprot:NODE_198_length_15297_cov_0.486182.p5 type:complete len:316 gc:universal NODE_198_length_15297_cov_0.486182:14978-14031(-)
MFANVNRRRIKEYTHFEKIEDLTSFGDQFIVLSKNILYFIDSDGKDAGKIPCFKYGCLMPLEHKKMILMASNPSPEMLNKINKPPKDIHAIRLLKIKEPKIDQGNFVSYFNGPEKKVLHMHASSEYLAATDGDFTFIWDLQQKKTDYTFKIDSSCIIVHLSKSLLATFSCKAGVGTVELFNVEKNEISQTRVIEINDCFNPLNMTYFNSGFTVMTKTKLFWFATNSADRTEEKIETEFAGIFSPVNIVYPHTNCLDSALGRVILCSDQGSLRVYDSNSNIERFKVFHSFLSFVKFNSVSNIVGCASGSDLKLLKF